MGDVIYFISCIIGIIILATPVWLYILIATLAENHVNPKKHDVEVFVYRYPNDIIVRTEYSPEQINRSDIQLLQAPSWYKPPVDTISCNTDETVENITTITPPVEPTIESTIELTVEPIIEHSEEPIEVPSAVDTNDTVSAPHVSSIYPLGIYDVSIEQDDRATYEMIKRLMCEEYAADTFISYEEFLVYSSTEDGPQKLRKRMHDDFIKRMKERATQRKPINRDVMSNHVKYISDSSRLDICKWTQVIMTNLGATPRDIADELGVNLLSVARFTSGEGYYVNIKLLAWFLNNDGYSDTHIIQERFAYENYDKKIRPIPSRSEYSLVLNTIYNSYIKAKNSGDQNVKLVLYMEYTKLHENDTVKQIEMPIIKPMLYYRYKDSEKTS